MKFTNPYAALDEAHMVRLQCWTGTKDYMLLQALNPSKGLIQTTYNLFLRKLAIELRRLGITNYERADDFKHIIGELFDTESNEFSFAIDRIVARLTSPPPPSNVGGTTEGTHTEANDGNVAGGTAGLRPLDEGTANEPRDVKASPRTGGGKRRDGGKAKANTESKRGKAPTKD